MATWDRRQFIQGIGFAVLTVQCLPLIAHAAETSPPDGRVEEDNLIVHSSSGFVPHVHDLLIPYAVLKAPPAEGIKLQSSKALFHAHVVALSQQELATVNGGGTVTQKASSHLFVITLAKRP